MRFTAPLSSSWLRMSQPVNAALERSLNGAVRSEASAEKLRTAHSTGACMRLSASDRARLVRIILRFSGAPIVMLGDLVADEFVYGQIARVSREAPVLILKQREKQILPGGGANAANNLVDVGARVILVGT